MKINYPETGYTPANLRAIQRDANLSRETIAILCGKDLRSIHAYAKQNRDKNARDMPAETWEMLQAKLEMASAVIDGLNEEESLVYQESYPDSEPTIHIQFDEDGYQANISYPPGNAYDWSDNECYIGVGLPMGHIDWQTYYEEYNFDPDADDRDEDEYDRIESEILKAETQKYINEKLGYWVNEIYNHFDEIKQERDI